VQHGRAFRAARSLWQGQVAADASLRANARPNSFKVHPSDYDQRELVGGASTSPRRASPSPWRASPRLPIVQAWTVSGIESCYAAREDGEDGRRIAGPWRNARGGDLERLDSRRQQRPSPSSASAAVTRLRKDPRGWRLSLRAARKILDRMDYRDLGARRVHWGKEINSVYCGRWAFICAQRRTAVSVTRRGRRRACRFGCGRKGR
jgi:hypothetical protein